MERTEHSGARKTLACLAKSATDDRVVCFNFLALVGPTERRGSLRRPSDVVAVVLGSPGLGEAAAVESDCALASEAVVLMTVSVGDGVRVARASAAAMPKGGAGAGAVSSTALSVGGLAVGLVGGMKREGSG